MLEVSELAGTLDAIGPVQHLLLYLLLQKRGSQAEADLQAARDELQREVLK